MATKAEKIHALIHTAAAASAAVGGGLAKPRALTRPSSRPSRWR